MSVLIYGILFDGDLVMKVTTTIQYTENMRFARLASCFVKLCLASRIMM